MLEPITDVNTQIVKVTGTVLPIGNGSVGKSSLAMTLQGMMAQDHHPVKTRNLELEYISDQFVEKNQSYQIIQQYFIPPGQKESQGDHSTRSYEDIVRIYDFILKKVDIILLSYDITSLETFQDLEFWMEQSFKLCHPSTHFILVGTHLDQSDRREVTSSMVQAAQQFLNKRLKEIQTDWQGASSALEMSNFDGSNSHILRRTVSMGILRVRGYFGKI